MESFDDFFDQFCKDIKEEYEGVKYEDISDSESEIDLGEYDLSDQQKRNIEAIDLSLLYDAVKSMQKDMNNFVTENNNLRVENERLKSIVAWISEKIISQYEM